MTIAASEENISDMNIYYCWKSYNFKIDSINFYKNWKDIMVIFILLDGFRGCSHKNIVIIVYRADQNQRISVTMTCSYYIN